MLPLLATAMVAKSGNIYYGLLVPDRGCGHEPDHRFGFIRETKDHKGARRPLTLTEVKRFDRWTPCLGGG